MIFSFDSEELRDTLENYDIIFDIYGAELGEKIILFLDLFKSCKNLETLNNLLDNTIIENSNNGKITYIAEYNDFSISFNIINPTTMFKNVNRIKILNVDTK